MTPPEVLAIYLAVGMPAAWGALRLLLRRLEG